MLNNPACPHCGHAPEGFSQNITHNLGKMANEVGLYGPLWRPEKSGIKHARQLIEPLELGINELKSRPVHYDQFNAENGWGTREQFVPWLEKLLDACKANPTATVEADV